jgi:hypothetical protein
MYAQEVRVDHSDSKVNEMSSHPNLLLPGLPGLLHLFICQLFCLSTLLVFPAHVAYPRISVPLEHESRSLFWLSVFRFVVLAIIVFVVI